MKKYKVLCIMFFLAGVCFVAGTINHLLNTKEGILSSLLLGMGCFCLSFSFYKMHKNK